MDTKLDKMEIRPASSENFITVVSVGEKIEEGSDSQEKEFVTVLRIGEDDPNFVTEEVLVYRLPGERLGFGLKFEGGTKANEYVKKLFIQSCAPDSPASKVVGSWGPLIEGDEVLVIDSRPVTTMTRMDCVKCLKDSSVVIKLLVRHQKKMEEGLPLVISAEIKKPPALPPKPPPVPPRKIPKRHARTVKRESNMAESKPTPQSRLKNLDSTGAISKHGGFPEPRTNRMFSEGYSAPPDPEYYVDLFSQDSIQSLSESDDTASTISTVVDRNGNSLPSTPKSIQKHLDISNFPDDENIFKITPDANEKFDFDLKPDPDRFSDGNVDLKTETDPPTHFDDTQTDFVFPTHDENMNIFSLPRLVDFVPKNISHMDHKKIMNLFLCCERGEHLDFKLKVPEDVQKLDSFNDDMFPKWSISPQLTTIGEDEEEENPPFSFMKPTLIVDCEGKNEENVEEIENQAMEPPPSDRRQPPDGHEFPDFIENFLDRTKDRFKTTISHEREITNRNAPENQFSLNGSETSHLSKMTSLSNVDLSRRETDENKQKEEKTEKTPTFGFYSRSQSLCDISTRPPMDDPLQCLVEQRRKNLSKLKGLVIPDSINECDPPAAINLPEIKSDTTSLIEQFNSIGSPEVLSEISEVSSNNNIVLPPITPAWAASVNFPKYSPAFKRKDLKIHSSGSKSEFESSLKLYSPVDSKRETFDFSIRPKSFDSSRSENSSDCPSRDKPKRHSYSSSRFYRKEFNTDEESENDSVMSSSQSSLTSRPTESSTTSVEKYGPPEFNIPEFRSGKLSSVEALNRKNILASAKCRSGKDFKIASPVADKKLQVDENKTEILDEIEKDPIQVKEDEIVDTPKKLLTKLTTINTFPEKVPSPVIKKVAEYPTSNLINLEMKNSSKTAPLAINKDKHSMFRNLLKPVPVAAKKEERISKFSNRKSLSVTDLRKNFEEIAKNVSTTPIFPSKKLEIHTKPPSLVPAAPATEESSTKKQRSSLSYDPPRESKEINKKSRKVILKPNAPGENVGIAITGGTENEKEIVVHRIRYGSVAYQDGTLIKGDLILSINGVPTTNLNYSDAVQLLKTPSESYVIEIALKDEVPIELKALKRRSISLDSTLNTEKIREDKISPIKKPTHEIILTKDQNGLGFSVEGGRDSPQGDVPIIVKKIFQGGVADKDGRLKVGDEIISINDIDFSHLTRIQAWTFMKKVDLGKTKIMIYR